MFFYHIFEHTRILRSTSTSQSISIGESSLVPFLLSSCASRHYGRETELLETAAAARRRRWQCSSSSSGGQQQQQQRQRRAAAATNSGRRREAECPPGLKRGSKEMACRQMIQGWVISLVPRRRAADLIKAPEHHDVRDQNPARGRQQQVEILDLQPNFKRGSK